MAGGQSPLEQWRLYMLTIRAALQHPISKQWCATAEGLEVTAIEPAHINALIRKRAEIAGQMRTYRVNSKRP